MGQIQIREDTFPIYAVAHECTILPALALPAAFFTEYIKEQIINIKQIQSWDGVNLFVWVFQTLSWCYKIV